MGRGRKNRVRFLNISLPPCATFYFPHPLILIFIISLHLWKWGTWCKLVLDIKKYRYFPMSSLSVIGKKECQIVLLFYQGTAFWLTLRKRAAWPVTLSKMNCLSYLKPGDTFQMGRKPLIIPLTKKEDAGNLPSSPMTGNRTQKRNPTSVQNAGRTLRRAPHSWTIGNPT